MKYLLLGICSLFISGASYASPCVGCHGTPPDDRSHSVHSGLRAMQAAYGDTGHTSNYVTRSSTYGFNCGNCHPQDRSKHQNGTLDVEVKQVKGGGLRTQNRGDATYNGAEKRCAGVYCHSSGGKDGNVTYARSPKWNREEKGSRCHECHDSPPLYKNTPQRPNGHFNSYRGSGHLLGVHWDSVSGHSKESFEYDTATQMGCSTCHNGTVKKDTDTAFVDPVKGLFTCSRCHDLRDGEIANYALHVNGRVDIQFAPLKVRTKAQMMMVPKGWVRHGKKGDAGSYDEANVSLSSVNYNSEEKSCSNVSCHLGGEKVFWYDTVDCRDCHTGF